MTDIDFPLPAALCTPQATYYNLFTLNGSPLGATRYVRFLFPNTDLLYVGKIQSVFVDHDNDNQPTAEIQTFPYAQNTAVQRPEVAVTSDITECYTSMLTMEIPLEQIVSPCRMVYVPPSVLEDNVLSYVVTHRNDGEHLDLVADDDDKQCGQVSCNNESTDEEDDRDDDLWLGYFRYTADEVAPVGHDTCSGLNWALPPEIMDHYLSWTSVQPTPWFAHDFMRYLNYKYLEPIIQSIAPRANVKYVFEALNHNSYTLVEGGCRLTKKITFRRVSHTVTQRQVNVLLALQEVIADLRKHSDQQQQQQNQGWLRQLFATCEELLSRSKAMLH